MKKKFVISVIAVILVIAFALLFYFLVFAPRNELNSYIKQNITEVDLPAQQYDKYDITHSGETIEASNEDIAVRLLSDYERMDNSMSSAQMYEKSGESIVILGAYKWNDQMNLSLVANESAYPDEVVKITSQDVVKGYQSIWNVTPDCAYNTLKCAYLTEKDSYSFWDINSQKAYIVSTMIKKTLSNSNRNVLVYEKDDICGFVSYFERTDDEITELKEKYGQATRYVATLDIFCKNDLNSSNTILVKVDSLDEIFAIMNSAKAV